MPNLLLWLGVIALIIIVVFRWNLLSHSFKWVFSHRFHPWLEKNATLIGAYRSFGWFLAIPFAFVGAYLVYHQVMDLLRVPDAALVFSHPSESIFWVVNPSSKVLREAKYQFFIVNLSLTAGQEPFLQLEIPTKIVDAIRPGGKLGPWTIKSLHDKGGRLKMDTIFSGMLL